LPPTVIGKFYSLQLLGSDLSLNAIDPFVSTAITVSKKSVRLLCFAKLSLSLDLFFFLLAPLKTFIRKGGELLLIISVIDAPLIFKKLSFK